MFRIIIMQNKRLLKYIFIVISFILVIFVFSNNNKNMPNGANYLIDKDYDKAKQYASDIRKSIEQIKQLDLIKPVMKNNGITEKSINKIKESLNIIDSNISEELILKLLSLTKAMQVLMQLQDNLPPQNKSIDLLTKLFNDYNRIIKLLKEQIYKSLI